MDYQIETYQEKFLEDQFKIGSGMYDKWRMGGQTRIEQLKTAYSAPDFDPLTRFYALLNEEIVGFLTASSIKDQQNNTYFEFPYYKKGHENSQQELAEHAFQKLRERGSKL